MVECRLKIDGDFIEKEAWDLFIQNHFPNYEMFWLKFVVPRTNRPQNTHTKESTPENERLLIMLHYSILINLYYSFKDLDNSYDRKTFENIYIRLASASDVCEEFLFRFLLWVKNKSTDGVLDEDKFKNSITPNKDEAKKALNKGKNYSIPIISKRDIIKKLTDSNYGKNLFEFIDLIRSYRNFLVHSWPMFQINNMLPKKEFVREYRDWVEVLKELEDHAKSATLIKTKYLDMKQMIIEDFFKLANLINELWNEVIKDLENKT